MLKKSKLASSESAESSNSSVDVSHSFRSFVSVIAASSLSRIEAVPPCAVLDPPTYRLPVSSVPPVLKLILPVAFAYCAIMVLALVTAALSEISIKPWLRNPTIRSLDEFHCEFVSLMYAVPFPTIRPRIELVLFTTPPELTSRYAVPSNPMTVPPVVQVDPDCT